MKGFQEDPLLVQELGAGETWRNSFRVPGLGEVLSGSRGCRNRGATNQPQEDFKEGSSSDRSNPLVLKVLRTFSLHLRGPTRLRPHPYLVTDSDGGSPSRLD